MPNYAFGDKPVADQMRDRYKIPAAAYLGGPETSSPDLLPKLAIADRGRRRPRKRDRRSGPPSTNRAVDPQPARRRRPCLAAARRPVPRPAGDSGNIVAKIGDEGALLVDSGAGTLAEKTLARVRQLSDKPIQYILNTGFQPEHTGGNVALRASGGDPSVRGSFFSLQFADAGVGATILAHQNVQNRRSPPNRAAAGVPSDTYLQERRRTFHNGDAIEMFWEARAVTDGDSIVHFRRADVIVTGDVFTTTQYPPIDVANGGSVQGEIDALNDILGRTRDQHQEEGGTIVVPGHGYVSDEHEVVEYRDMVVIVRDRVQAMTGRARRSTRSRRRDRLLITTLVTVRQRVRGRPIGLWRPCMRVSLDAKLTAASVLLRRSQPVGAAAADGATEARYTGDHRDDRRRPQEPRRNSRRGAFLVRGAPRESTRRPADAPNEILDSVDAIGNSGTTVTRADDGGRPTIERALRQSGRHAAVLPGFRAAPSGSRAGQDRLRHARPRGSLRWSGGLSGEVRIEGVRLERADGR